MHQGSSVELLFFLKLLCFCSYVIPVMLLSVVLNVPKFMESNFTWTPIESNATTAANSSDETSIEYEIGFEVSELREHPDYIKYYTMWTRLITTGIIPLGALIYFNFGIFRGIQVRLSKNMYNKTL